MFKVVEKVRDGVIIDEGLNGISLGFVGFWFRVIIRWVNFFTSIEFFFYLKELRKFLKMYLIFYLLKVFKLFLSL